MTDEKAHLNESSNGNNSLGIHTFKGKNEGIHDSKNSNEDSSQKSGFVPNVVKNSEQLGYFISFSKIKTNIVTKGLMANENETKYNMMLFCKKCNSCLFNLKLCSKCFNAEENTGCCGNKDFNEVNVKYEDLINSLLQKQLFNNVINNHNSSFISTFLNHIENCDLMIFSNPQDSDPEYKMMVNDLFESSKFQEENIDISGLFEQSKMEQNK